MTERTITDNAFLALVLEELISARRKHSDPHYCMTAATEEIGELAKAILHTVDANEPTPYAKGSVLYEAVQLASMAVRIATEGDHSLRLMPCTVPLSKKPAMIFDEDATLSFKPPLSLERAWNTGYQVQDRNGHRVATFVEASQAETFIKAVNRE